MNNGGFKDLLALSWNTKVVGNPKDRLSLKLKGLKPLLKVFHKEHYSNLSGRVMKARENLAKIQDLCFKFPADLFLHDLEKDLVQQFHFLSHAEESYKRQKSRVNGLALGDKNTKKFHQKMDAHRMRNTTLSLVNSEGIRLEDPVANEGEILGYYQELLGTKFTHRRDATAALSTAIHSKVPQELYEGLSGSVSEIEVWNALKSIHRDRAPGPDGFNSAFFLDN